MKTPRCTSILFLLTLLFTGVLTGCSSPAGKAAKHKAKKVSPVHETKGEKVKKDVGEKVEKGVPETIKER